jgi:hypothetical protein
MTDDAKHLEIAIREQTIRELRLENYRLQFEREEMRQKLIRAETYLPPWLVPLGLALLLWRRA